MLLSQRVINWLKIRQMIPAQKSALCLFVVDKGSLSEPPAACSLPEQYQEKPFPSWAHRRELSVSWESTSNEFSDLNVTAGNREKMRNPHCQRLPPSNDILS